MADDRDVVPERAMAHPHPGRVADLPRDAGVGRDPVPPVERVDHPPHYGGADDPYEAIKVIEAWDLGFNLGNTVKYIRRCGRVGAGAPIVDLKKARWYLDREIQNMEKALENEP
jgi:uncharacterized protein DUF3310